MTYSTQKTRGQRMKIVDKYERDTKKKRKEKIGYTARVYIETTYAQI